MGMEFYERIDKNHDCSKDHAKEKKNQLQNNPLNTILENFTIAIKLSYIPQKMIVELEIDVIMNTNNIITRDYSIFIQGHFL
jgi:hypothetical protein